MNRVSHLTGAVCLFLLSNFAGAQCPADIPGYSFLGERDNHRYFISESNFKHLDANAAAAAQGGYMASITSQAENDFLKERITEITHIGLSDVDNEGVFVWPSGEAVTFNNLSVSNSAENDYANMNFWNGGWGLDSFWASRKYILEIPCEDDGTVCPAPSIQTTEDTPTDPLGIWVQWTPVEQADSYIIQWTNVADGMVNSRTSELANVQIVDGVELAQTYDIRVRSQCGARQSEFSGVKRHTTEQGQADVGPGFFRGVQVLPPGEPTIISIAHAVINTGNIDATFEIRYLLSTDNTFSTDDIRLPRFNNNDPDADIITLRCCFTSNETGGVFTIPPGLESGDYFLLGVMDPDGLVPGVAGTAIRQVTIDPAPGAFADLGLRLASYPDTIRSGDSFVMEIQTSNIGNTVTAAAYDVDVYISPDDTDPGNDLFLATASFAAGQDPGEIGLSSANIQIPDLPEGAYRFRFDIDPDNNVPEFSEENTAFRSFNLLPREPGNNECPGDITGYTTMGEFGGSKYYFSDERANWSEAQSAARAQAGYLASINNIEENRFIFERINEIVLIGLNDRAAEGVFVWDSGEGLTYNNITGDGNSARNDYANMNFWNGGWDFDNELVARRYVMEIPCDNIVVDGKPDLNISSLSAIPSGRPGDVINFTFDLNNFEAATASDNYRIGMYISTDSILSNNDVLAGVVPTGNTSQGTISDVPGAITIPATLAPGSYFLIVKADIDNVIDETIESNNLASGSFSVTSGPASGIDLELDMSVDPATHKDWSNFTFTITAINKGSERATGIEIFWNRSDPDNIAFVSVSANKGESAGWTGKWDNLSLDPGESATLDVVYFFKTQTTPSSLFAHVTKADQNDIDSTPGNGQNVDMIVREDDEAKATVSN